MPLFRNLLSRRFQLFPKPQNHTCAYHIVQSNATHRRQFLLFMNRTIASSPQIEDPSKPNSDRKKTKTPLHILFRQAVDLSEKRGNSETDSEGEAENDELKTKLKQLEGEVWSLKANSSAAAKWEKPKKPERKSLYDMFTNQTSTVGKLREVTLKEPIFVNELSQDMKLFVEHLYKRGYFKDANFAKDKKLNLSLFENRYAWEYIKQAAETFGRDNQELAKWVSGKYLKEVALFGCPSVDKTCVFAAKRLRRFFQIQENTVCSNCLLKPSCKYRNKTLWKTDTNKLDLGSTMKFITSYALGSVDPRLVVPNEIKECISRLLKEVLKPSKTK